MYSRCCTDLCLENKNMLSIVLQLSLLDPEMRLSYCLCAPELQFKVRVQCGW